MIKLVEWLLGLDPGPRVDLVKHAQLDEQLSEAEGARVEARKYRDRAERLGPEQRRRLKQNHFGEGMTEALHQRGWTQQ